MPSKLLKDRLSFLKDLKEHKQDGMELSNMFDERRRALRSFKPQITAWQIKGKEQKLFSYV